MKYLIPLVLILFIAIPTKEAFAQKKDSTSNGIKRKIVFTPGVSYQREFFGELNLMYAKPLEGGSCSNIMGFTGPRIGFESNFRASNVIVLAPKIGYEYSFLLFCVRGSAVCYFLNGQTDLRIVPEAGIGFWGYLNLTYGFGIPLLKDRIREISMSRISLTLTL